MGISENREAPKVPDEFITLFRSSLEKNKLTLIEVADKVGISQSYLSRLLNKERGLPPDEKIIQIAKALKIEPPETLLFSAGKVLAPKGNVDSSKIDECLKKIDRLSDESADIKKAAKESAIIGWALVSMVALVGVILGAVALYRAFNKKEAKHES